MPLIGLEPQTADRQRVGERRGREIDVDAAVERRIGLAVGIGPAVQRVRPPVAALQIERRAARQLEREPPDGPACIAFDAV